MNNPSIYAMLPSLMMKLAEDRGEPKNCFKGEDESKFSTCYALKMAIFKRALVKTSVRTPENTYRLITIPRILFFVSETYFRTLP